MTTEQDKALEAVNIAIQMETDGKEFYLKAGEASSNELGKKLLNQLAAEEDIHRKKFVQIFESMRTQQGWPEVEFQPDGGQNLRTIFARATQELGPDVKVGSSEMEAVKTAMDMESKTFDFYNERIKNAAFDAETKYYTALAAQEREHHLILYDYYEYLKDPAAWFVSKEHHSLDGG